MNKWIKRVDQLKEKHDLKSDRQAAKYLNISQQALNKIRRGENEMGVATKLRLLDQLGFTNLRDAILEILPDETGEQIKSKMNKITKKLVDK